MLCSGVSISDESIKLWSSIGSRKSNLKACLHAFTEDRKKIIPIERAIVEKDDPKPWESFCSLLREYGSDQVRFWASNRCYTLYRSLTEYIQCLFGYYDCSIMISSGQGSGLSDRPVTKTIFEVWVPSGASTKDKMLSSSSRATFKNKIGQPEYEWQLFNEEDLGIESRIEFGLRKVRGKITKFEGIPI